MAQNNLQNSGFKGESGKYQPKYPNKLNRSLNHAEMNYNLDLVGQVIYGYRIMGSGPDGAIDLTNDANKVLKLHKVIEGNTHYINNGAAVGDYIWITAESGIGDGTASLVGGVVTGDLIPDTDVAYDLGSPTNKFRDIYLSNNTIYLGDNSIGITNGKLNINGSIIDTDTLSEEGVSSIIATITSVESDLQDEITSIESNVSSTIDSAVSTINNTISDTNVLVDSAKGETSAEFLAINNSIENRVSDLQTILSGEISDGDFVLDQKIDTVSASLGNDITGAEANIRQDINALVTSSEAFAQLTTSVETAFNTASSETIAGLDSLSTFLADADEAIITEARSLNAAVSTELTNTNIVIGANTTALATADAALIELEELLTAEISSERLASTAEITSLTQVAVSADEVVITEARSLNASISSELIQTAAGIASDITILTNEDTALSNRIDSLTAEISTDTIATNAAIDSAATAYVTSAEALANRIDSLTAEISGDNLATSATIGSIETAYATADTAVINQASSLISQLSSDELAVTASIENSLTALVNEDEAMIQRAESLTTRISSEEISSAAGLSSIETAYTSEDEALSTRINNLNASVSTDILATNADISSIETAYANADSALSTRINNLTASVSTDILATNANIDTIETTIANQDFASASQVETLEAEFTINGDGDITGLNSSSAILETINTVVATGDQATLASATSAIVQLDGQIAGVTSGISADIDNINSTIEAQYTLEVNADGNVAGMKLGADGSGSSIAFTADSFKVSTGGPQGQLLTPFSIVDGQVAFNGEVSFSEGPQGPAGDPGTPGTPGPQGPRGLTGPQGPAPDTSTYLTTSTTINGGQITTGIIKNGNFSPGTSDYVTGPASNWSAYSVAGMGINLDLGAIAAKSFYIDPEGNAKFKGDIDIEGDARIGGSLMKEFFDIGEVPVGSDPAITRPILRMKPDAYIGDETFNTFRDDVIRESSSEDRIQNITLSHQYIKRNDVLIEPGDLVKLDANNELIKADAAKDTAIVGILWTEVDYSIKPNVLDKYLEEERVFVEEDHHYRDSLGVKLQPIDRENKALWKVASIGDALEDGLTGFKVCDQNGPVTKGDLLCSSDVPGYVMKQPVEYVIIGFEDEIPQYEERQTINSFTVGKCMEDCQFDENGKTKGIYGYLYCG